MLIFIHFPEMNRAMRGRRHLPGLREEEVVDEAVAAPTTDVARRHVVVEGEEAGAGVRPLVLEVGVNPSSPNRTHPSSQTRSGRRPLRVVMC